MNKIFRCTLILSVLLFSCKKEIKSKDTDNIFKFKEYIVQVTNGEVSKNSEIRISLAKDIKDWSQDKIIPEDILSISPNIKGEIEAVNATTLIFKPSEKLESNKVYEVELNLGRLFSNVPDQFNSYTFKFKTIEQNFSIKTSNLQSYDKKWQFLEGSINAADIMSIDEAKSILKANQDGLKRNVKWNSEVENSTSFAFKIDSIQRFEDDSEIEIEWKGKNIGVDYNGSEKIKILGINNFSVIRTEIVQSPEQYLKINFSNPLEKRQNFSGLVSIEDESDLKFIVEGNLLKIYPKSRIIGDRQITVFEGIKSSDGYKLKKSHTKDLSFQQLKPAIRLLSNGVILPNSSNLKFNFEAVNLRAVDIKIIKIYEDNVLQFLQYNSLGSKSYYELRQVGRRVAQKSIRLVKDATQNNGKWKAYAFDLSKIIKADPGAIYRIELSIKKEYSLYDCTDNALVANVEGSSVESYFEKEFYLDNKKEYSKNELKEIEDREELYWDKISNNYNDREYYNWNDRENPCKVAYFDNEDRIVSANILASDVGVIIKKGEEKNYFVAVNDIITTDPIQGAEIKFYNYQQQPIGTSKTNNDGFSNVQLEKNAYFAIVTKKNSSTYVKIDDGHSLSTSKYDVSGMKLKKGLKGYLYGERGVWRPGDTIHLTFVLDDKLNPLPINHPIKLELFDARGKLVHRQINTEGINGFSRFSVATKDGSPTGNWLANISVGGAKFSKNLKVETIKPNRLKIKIDFDKEILKSTEPISAKINLNWLHGAPGKNLKTEVKVKLTSTNAKFKGFEKYVFKDPIKTFDSEEITIFDKEVDENGKGLINKRIPIKNYAPGMLRATFLSKAYEKGGDFSIDVFSMKFSPYTSFVGLQSPKPKAFGSFFTDENNSFQLATVNDEGKPISRKDLEVKIYKIEWRWWWNSSYDDLASYVGSQYHKPYKSFKISTNNDGRANIKINIPDVEGGRYLIRIVDPLSGHATGRTVYFYKNWWQSPSGGNSEAATMLIFSSDKEVYAPGDVAKIKFPSSTEGRALVSLENGTNVISTQWVKTNKGETTVEIPIVKEMAPNFFVNISLLQPHAKTVNDLPIRLYGIIPIYVVEPSTKVKPVISMPESIRPEEEFIVKVSESNGKKMTYTIAVVDDGLLDLTRFKTPNAWNEFYKKEALGVKTWDIYDEVIGAYSGSINQVFSIGGDEDLNKGKSKKAKRFKPVVIYLGPFVLEKGKSKSHKILMPNYVGSVRTMVVAGDKSSSAYGNAEVTTLVKKPLMILASLPRKLSPKEIVRIPVTVFAMDQKIKDVEIKLKSNSALKIIGQTSQRISFDKPDEKMVYFDVEIQDELGMTEIEIVASGNRESASVKTEMDIVNPNPLTSKLISKRLEGKGEQIIDLSTFGVKGTNKATIEFSTLPPINFSKRLDYLIRYPHGCIEQTTSSVFPQLFLSDIFDLKNDREIEIDRNIKKAIERIENFQRPNGGLSYWIGQNSTNDWGTSYAGHFMIEAEKKGYVLPFNFKSNWIKYQKEQARNWRSGSERRNSDLAQSYRLFTLALVGQADLASMNRLREGSKISNEAKWRLAAAYALASQKEVAKEIIQTANIHFTPNKRDYYTYGSVDRNRAMALETLTMLEDSRTREMTEILARELSSDKWMSTQTTAFSLLAISKTVEKNGGKEIDMTFKVGKQSESVKTKQAIAQRELIIDQGLNQVKIENMIDNNVYVRIINSGKLPLGEEFSERRGLHVSASYRDANNNRIDISKISQGTEFKAVVKVTNLSKSWINDLAMTEIFPSGWEIINMRFTDYGSTQTESGYTDIRDDRANFYFDLGANKTRTFEITLNASYLGKYYLYGIQAEAMYDNNYFTRTKGHWVEVIK